MNKLKLFVATLLGAAAIGSGAALADASDFNSVDANHDSYVSFEEAQGQFTTLDQATFDKVDANHDGKLDEAEYGTLLGLAATLSPNNEGTASSSSAM